MTDDQQQLIFDISKEITNALISCEHHRNQEDGIMDKVDAYIKSYVQRINLLREIRTKLENEFTIIHYDPR